MKGTCFEYSLHVSILIEKLIQLVSRTVTQIGGAGLPAELEDLIVMKLSDDSMYAVRSSACGEDSEETSAAGQMETILGVRGRDAIVSAIAKCWASQFSFVAVQYRRFANQTGELLSLRVSTLDFHLLIGPVLEFQPCGSPSQPSEL